MSESTEYPALILRRGEDRRLRAGHLWVFSNEVDVQRTPLDRFQVGQTVCIVDASGTASIWSTGSGLRLQNFQLGLASATAFSRQDGALHLVTNASDKRDVAAIRTLVAVE